MFISIFELEVRPFLKSSSPFPGKVLHFLLVPTGPAPLVGPLTFRSCPWGMAARIFAVMLLSRHSIKLCLESGLRYNDVLPEHRVDVTLHCICALKPCERHRRRRHVSTSGY